MKNVNKTHPVRLASAVLGLLALAGSLIPTSAQAGRIDVRTLTCVQAFSLVQQNRGVVLTLTDRTYDRIVRSDWDCSSHEEGERVLAQTRDNPKCYIGLRCVPSSGSGFFEKFRPKGRK